MRLKLNRKLCAVAVLLLSLQMFPQGSSLLKYVVYDFDGLDIGQTDLPDGDFSHGDAAHSIAANPAGASDVIGDRTLKVKLTWQSGSGEFGKAMNRYIDLNAGADRLNFYVYNPSSNSESAQIDVLLLEDDNSNDQFEDSGDDKWIHPVTVPRGSGWQLISLPLSAFQDGNAGGNGQVDARYGTPGGMLFTVAFVFKKPLPTAVSDEYYIDMICFSDGAMPVGASVLDLPAPATNGQCALGALGGNPDPAQVPSDIHAYLPQDKKLSLINWFMYYSTSGSVANSLPGQEVQQLLDNGYQPIITWESMYAQYSRLDPVQPRLDAILNGDFNSYIDAFANKIKSYNGTIIMRIFHEFEGDWYPWSLTHNGQDPAKYVSAFRHVVNRFRAAGANNVKWMWCLNAEPKPYARYNAVTSCYPGDEYVDIVATDIYNHPDLGVPAWKSFRYTMAESYYYLAKYYSHKPIYICEVGSRERYGSEPGSSESKAAWLCRMSKDLKSYFSLTRALVFFSTKKEHDWRINSSDPARQAFVDCIWSDSYYGGVVSIGELPEKAVFHAFPNPFSNELRLLTAGVPDTGEKVQIRVFDISGKIVYALEADLIPATINIGRDLPVGVYVLEMQRGHSVQRQKLLRAGSR